LTSSPVFRQGEDVNDSFIKSLGVPVGLPDTRSYLNPEEADKKLPMYDERLQDWRRNMAKLRDMI